ncbi:hypothetical protein HUK65_15915 [Rhodobacteraceae bacterium 2376]|uniref:Uncharacterized protein n=1 Tax=Rhabdonatronobacter sediminivivens TaxID=2743469 RepID=A0A7Z0I1Z0_9RHOB|nr:hypothetical protein [Rhabdonatronobacter sediminivivens]NYS26472.1 hypothetical protein [Rhabdonatronobacter sediminivivens]
MKLPAQPGKVTLAELSALQDIQAPAGDAMPQEAPCLFHETRDGLRFDYLWHPRPGSGRLFVLFSGMMNRKKGMVPPVFQRWSWADHFPGHCLYVSDPFLHLDDRVELAWYAGTAACDPMVQIIETARKIAAPLGIPAQEIYGYGSSGGGFAALRLAAMMDGANAICINPQTDVTKYQASGKRYLKIAFGAEDRQTAAALVPERVTLAHYRTRLRDCRIIYIQNVLDRHHYDDHYQPFCRMMGQDSAENDTRGNFRRLLFSHEGGHKRAETPEVFARAMSIVQDWSV